MPPTVRPAERLPAHPRRNAVTRTPVAHVGQGVVGDAAGKSVHQVDVVVIGVADGKKTPLLAIGEAKWGEVMDSAHIDRLRLINSLISAAGRYDTAQTKLICFSGVGFTR